MRDTPAAVAAQQTTEREHARARFSAIRARSEDLCAPLAVEDYVVQSMPDVSPAKWHLAHTSWFFETFILLPHAAGYEPFDPAFGYLFNSYYEAVGPRHPRPERGLITRPTVAEIYDYRAHVDRAMAGLIGTAAGETWRRIAPLLALGFNHEQQHQELILTDIKHVLSRNPLHPAYRADAALPGAAGPPKLAWHGFAGGVHEIGHGGEAFAFDNEGPRHRVYLEDFCLASRPVTNGEFREFIADGGYQDARLWLSDGWAAVSTRDWRAPLYWEQHDGNWHEMTLGGLRALDDAAPVCHLSLYEADAYARWAGKRLPREGEWEVAATDSRAEVGGNLMESGRLHPAAPEDATTGLSQLYGDVWEWTQSAYSPYPAFHPASGAIGEYNGKFMSGQMVLRGGSCATPTDHIRATYRNFFPPDARWQFSGLRLAEDG